MEYHFEEINVREVCFLLLLKDTGIFQTTKFELRLLRMCYLQVVSNGLLK